jgi:hypothetical protein
MVLPRLSTKFVLSAALAALAIRMALGAWREPLSIALAVVLALLLVVPLPSYFARRRAREVLQSGDVRSVLNAWAGSLDNLPYPETMGPLIAAAAFASCGWLDQARRALERSERGPAWDDALEHRLFVETLLDAFEGDREGALSKASHLSSLPVPPSGRVLQGRVRIFRNAIGAVARAFAHTSTPSDIELLQRASKVSPLAHWAMRYAAAVVAIDHGNRGVAKKMLAMAPLWPDGSAFRSFHEELSGMLAD